MATTTSQNLSGAIGFLRPILVAFLGHCCHIGQVSAWNCACWFPAPIAAKAPVRHVVPGTTANRRVVREVRPRALSSRVVRDTDSAGPAVAVEYWDGANGERDMGA